MAYILDSDVVTLYVHHQNQQPQLVGKIQSTPPYLLWVTMITVSEMLNGAFRLINDDRRDFARKLNDGELLRKIMEGLGAFQILPMSDQANAIFKGLPAAVKRIGPQDCKIAAIAKHAGFTVVTRNVAHFQKICDQMGVQYEDWTVAQR